MRGRLAALASTFLLIGAAACSLETSPLRVDGRDGGLSRDGGGPPMDGGPGQEAGPPDGGEPDAGPPAECRTSDDCPPATDGAWEPCGGFDGTCDQTGTERRTVTEPACVSGRCTATTRVESRDCVRPTDGTACGSASPGPWGECGGFSHGCDQSGTRTRTVSHMVCRGGACSSETTTETGACARDTGGDLCTLPGDCAGRCAFGACVVACLDCSSVCPAGCAASCGSAPGFGTCCKCAC